MSSLVETFSVMQSARCTYLSRPAIDDVALKVALRGVRRYPSFYFLSDKALSLPCHWPVAISSFPFAFHRLFCSRFSIAAKWIIFDYLSA